LLYFILTIVAQTAPDPDAVKLAFNRQSLLIVEGALALVMFGVALDLRIADFRQVFARPLGPLAGLATQVLLVPALVYLLTLALQPPPSIALGMILVAACPSGAMSNFVTHLAKGNTALSVSLAAISTLLAVITTPFNLGLWGNLNPATRELLHSVELSWVQLASTVLFVLVLPTALGMVVAARRAQFAARVQPALKRLSVGFLLVIIVVAVQQNFAAFTEHFSTIIVAVILENTLAMVCGYGVARLIRLPEADARALTIEVGIHNSALGLTLVFSFFGGLGGMALVAGFWSVWHLLAGLGIALYWSRRPPAT